MTLIIPFFPAHYQTSIPEAGFVKSGKSVAAAGVFFMTGYCRLGRATKGMCAAIRRLVLQEGISIARGRLEKTIALPIRSVNPSLFAELIPTYEDCLNCDLYD